MPELPQPEPKRTKLKRTQSNPSGGSAATERNAMADANDLEQTKFNEALERFKSRRMELLHQWNQLTEQSESIGS